MNKAYIIQYPKCPTHKGTMKMNFPADRFECLGFDGEGCDHIVYIDDIKEEIGTFGTEVVPGE